MNYLLRIDQNNPHRERLEMAITNLLPFVEAEAVYISYNESNKVIVITFVLKENCDQDGEALSTILDRLIRIYPDFIFKFISSGLADHGFSKGKPYFIQHCTLKELIYFEPGAKVFYPRKNNSKVLVRKARKRFYLDMEAAVVSFRNVSVYTRNNKNTEAAFALYQTLRYIYICASEFFTPVFISSTCLFSHYDYVVDFAPTLKKILNKDIEADREILKMLNKAYSSVVQNTDMGDIDPMMIVTAKTKVALIQKEMNQLFLEYNALCREKMQKLCCQKIIGKHIFNDKIPSNYFVEGALKNVGALLALAFKIRCVYCFGYTILQNQECKENYSGKLPRYHFYLLVVNLDQMEDEVPLMKDLIREKFEGRYKVTILSHCSEFIRKRKQNQKYFFNYIITNGILVYSNPYYLVYPKSRIAKWEPDVIEKYGRDKILTAQQLFSQAQDCFYDNEITVKRTVFRKVMEQVSIGLIYLYLGYLPHKLPMNRLFSLLKYIQEVELPFDFSNEKEKALFQYLSETAVVSITKETQDHIIEFDKLIEYKCILFLKYAKDLAEQEAGKLDY